MKVSIYAKEKRAQCKSLCTTPAINPVSKARHAGLIESASGDIPTLTKRGAKLAKPRTSPLLPEKLSRGAQLSPAVLSSSPSAFSRSVLGDRNTLNSRDLASSMAGVLSTESC